MEYPTKMACDVSNDEIKRLLGSPIASSTPKAANPATNTPSPDTVIPIEKPRRAIFYIGSREPSDEHSPLLGAEWEVVSPDNNGGGRGGYGAIGDYSTISFGEPDIDLTNCCGPCCTANCVELMCSTAIFLVATAIWIVLMYSLYLHYFG